MELKSHPNLQILVFSLYIKICCPYNNRSWRLTAIVSYSNCIEKSLNTLTEDMIPPHVSPANDEWVYLPACTGNITHTKNNRVYMSTRGFKGIISINVLGSFQLIFHTPFANVNAARKKYFSTLLLIDWKRQNCSAEKQPSRKKGNVYFKSFNQVLMLLAHAV